MKAHEILQKAHDLLADRQNWAQNRFAYDKYGDPADPTGKRATCWCSVGAVYKVTGRDGSQESNEAFDMLDGVLEVHFNWTSSISDYNDTHTHEQVLAVFSKALELAEAEGG